MDAWDTFQNVPAPRARTDRACARLFWMRLSSAALTASGVPGCGCCCLAAATSSSCKQQRMHMHHEHPLLGMVGTLTTDLSCCGVICQRNSAVLPAFAQRCAGTCSALASASSASMLPGTVGCKHLYCKCTVLRLPGCEFLKFCSGFLDRSEMLQAVGKTQWCPGINQQQLGQPTSQK